MSRRSPVSDRSTPCAIEAPDAPPQQRQHHVSTPRIHWARGSAVHVSTALRALLRTYVSPVGGHVVGAMPSEVVRIRSGRRSVQRHAVTPSENEAA